MEATLQGKVALVVGGSRGLGRGAVEALAARGAKVTVVGREARTLEELRAELRESGARERDGGVGARDGGGVGARDGGGARVDTVVGDASDEVLAERLLRERRPDVVVLVAGATPVLGAFYEGSWADFQRNWNADTKIAFAWLRAALRLPLAPASHLIVISSGAAIGGSPASGGYASAKRAQWFLADYAATESKRAGLGLRVHVLLPDLNASTALGRAGVAEYARRGGITDEELLRRFAPPQTPALFGSAVAQLAAAPERWEATAYRLGGRGLTPLPG